MHNSSVYKQSSASVLLEMDPTVCPTTTTTTTTTTTIVYYKRATITHILKKNQGHTIKIWPAARIEVYIAMTHHFRKRDYYYYY